jgi:type IV pilus biogenesis protein CpaD/CtpE
MKTMDVLFFAVALSVAACATSGTGGTGTTPASGENPVVAAIAGKLGIDPKYVGMALSAAQGALNGGGGQAAAPEVRDTAAKQGVNQAAAAAQADGKPLSDDQKSGLLDSVKGLL